MTSVLSQSNMLTKVTNQTFLVSTCKNIGINSELLDGIPQMLTLTTHFAVDLLLWHLRNERHHIKLKSKSPNYVFGSVRVYEVTAKGTELACTSSQGINPSQSQSITAIPGRSFIYFLYFGPNCCSPFGPQHVHYIRFDKTFGRSTFQPASHLLKVARI